MASSSQQKIVTSKLDFESRRLLRREENDPKRYIKSNIQACQALAEEKGYPKPGWVIWALESKARLNSWAKYVEELGPKGKIGSNFTNQYLFAMVAAYEPDGNCYIYTKENSGKRGSAGGASGTSGTSEMPAVAPTTSPDVATNEQMVQVATYEHFEPCVNDKKKSTVMHQMYAKIRLSRSCGGNAADRGHNITIANDTGSSVQIIEEHVWEACKKGKNLSELVGAEVKGPIIDENSPGEEAICRKYVATEIRLFADKARTKPLTPWFEEQACTIPDAPKGREPHYLSGRSLRKNLIFASPKGNHCLIVGTDQAAVAKALEHARPKEKKTKPAKDPGA